MSQQANARRPSRSRIPPIPLLFMFCILLVAGGFTATHLSDSYQVRQAIDANTIDGWNDLLQEYLSVRSDAWPLVVPTSVLLADDIEKALDKINWRVTDDPHWYWTFNMGTFYYDSDRAQPYFQEGLKVVIYEDILTDEILLMADLGKGYEELLAYRAPRWPQARTEAEFQDILYVELSRRRIVGAFTLHSREWGFAHEESLVNEPVLLESGGEGLRDNGTFAVTDFLRSTNGLRLEFDGATSSYYKVESASNLLDQGWYTTNMLLGTAGTMSWTYVTSPGEPTYFFYRVRQLSRSNPGDEDTDGMDDVWELVYLLDPLDASDALSDTDADGLTSYQEYRGDTRPNAYDSNTNNVPDGWDLYTGDLPPGDVNGDGTVSSADLSVLDNLLAGSANNVNPVVFAQADLNRDGVLDQIDRNGLLDLLDGKPILFVLDPVLK